MGHRISWGVERQVLVDIDQPGQHGDITQIEPVRLLMSDAGRRVTVTIRLGGADDFDLELLESRTLGRPHP